LCFDFQASAVLFGDFTKSQVYLIFGPQNVGYWNIS